MTWGRTMGDIAVRRIGGTPSTQGTEPPDNGNMEYRISKLEDFAIKTGERLSKIDIRLERIETRLDAMATREDMHREIGAQTWRIVGSMITFGTLLSAVMYFIVRNVH